ncbi:hypothetical protein KI387_007874, partial [Taxus chinensis]
TKDANENNLCPFVHLLPEHSTGQVSPNARGFCKKLPLQQGLRFPSARLPQKHQRGLHFLRRGLKPTPHGLHLSQPQPQGSPCAVGNGIPFPRVMGDMLLLLTGDVLIINKAKKGSASWFTTCDPVFTGLACASDQPNRFMTKLRRD